MWSLVGVTMPVSYHSDVVYRTEVSKPCLLTWSCIAQIVANPLEEDMNKEGSSIFHQFSTPKSEMLSRG